MSLHRLLRSRKSLKVLLVADDRQEIGQVRRALRRGRGSVIKVSVVPRLDLALRHLETEDVDLVAIDLAIGDATGTDVVRQLRRTAPTIPIIAIAEEPRERDAILALQRDAQDYVLRHQLNPATLTRAVRYALEPDRWQGQYRRLLGISPDGAVVGDAEGRVIFVNSSSARMLGRVPIRSDELPPSMRGGVTEALDVSLDGGRAAEIRAVETLWSGRPARLITMRDITKRLAAEMKVSAMARELRGANERLERLVDTDPLTLVLNRRGLAEIMAGELHRIGRTGDPLTAVLIDCDDFKSINDSFGHGVGDAALTALAGSVQETLRVGDHVGRVGGDEFLVLLPATTIAEGIVVADKIRRAIKGTTLPVSADGLTLSASLAVGAVEREIVSIEEILASVADGLRRSKAQGKDVVSGSLGSGREPQLSSSGAMPDTVLHAATIGLYVVVQEIRRLVDGAAVGCEALMRGPSGAFAMPADLFRAAFEQNALTALDLRALRTSMECLRERTWPGWYHVNLFPSTLLNVSTDRIIPMLAQGGMREGLCVELSEQQFLGDPAYLRPSIRDLRSAGCRVAIDDVGFGRSSVEALMVLEPDIVKVDRRCIRALTTDAGERRQLERLLAMLRAVEATVIVEGIETPDELNILRDLGVHYGQGYLWGQPARTLPAPPRITSLADGRIVAQ